MSRVAILCVLCAGLVGCESLQRKFTRKPKHPVAPPTPIINFMDYSHAMTPMDRYRKHYMMFDYWNDQLIQELQASSPNPKRYRHASVQALQELQELPRLLTDEVGSRFRPLIDQRARIHEQLQSGTFTAPGAGAIRRDLESQTRQIHREFFWRDVEPSVKPLEEPQGQGTSVGQPAAEPADQTPQPAADAEHPSAVSGNAR